MNRRKTQLRPQLVIEQAKRSRGAQARSLAAEHLLLNPNEFPRASKEDAQSLVEYVREKGWKTLYRHDRRMYKLLKDGARVLKGCMNIPPPPRPSPLDNVECLAEITRDLRDGTGNLSAKKIVHLFGIRPGRLAHWLRQKSSVVTFNPSAGFLQNGLMYFEGIARLRAVLSDEMFRKWLRSPNQNLENEAPLSWLDDGMLQNILDLVDDMLTGAPM
jgi:hypothetical protein